MNLNDRVIIKKWNVTGFIVCISNSVRSGIQYLVEYKDESGRLAEWWTAQSEIEKATLAD